MFECTSGQRGGRTGVGWRGRFDSMRACTWTRLVHQVSGQRLHNDAREAAAAFRDCRRKLIKQQRSRLSGSRDGMGRMRTKSRCKQPLRMA
eukprot:364999-Chlamydomonas_euryale.AAC.6